MVWHHFPVEKWKVYDILCNDAKLREKKEKYSIFKILFLFVVVGLVILVVGVDVVVNIVVAAGVVVVEIINLFRSEQKTRT